jgi:hypothetical protein
MKPVDIETSEHQSENNLLDNISNNEILKIIEDNIHTKYRETYLKVKGGIKVTKNELVQLQKHIQSILKDHNYE